MDGRIRAWDFAVRMGRGRHVDLGQAHCALLDYVVIGQCARSLSLRRCIINDLCCDDSVFFNNNKCKFSRKRNRSLLGASQMRVERCADDVVTLVCPVAQQD